MKRTIRTLAAASLMLLYLFVWSAPSMAQGAATLSGASSPRTLSYQGVISMTGKSGSSVAGTHQLTVTLYGDAAGTQKLWQQSTNARVDSNGVFNTALGTDANPLPEPVALDRPMWVGVAIDRGPELRPLSEVTASAYALNVVDNAITTPKLADGAVRTAKLADNSVSTSKIADSSVTTAKIADNSITWNKMATEYVPYIRVNGSKINTGNNPINFTGGNGLKVDYDSNSMSVIIHPDSSVMNLDNGRGKGASPMSTAHVAFWNSGAIDGGPGGAHAVLHGEGTGSAPTYGAVDLTQEVTGILPAANGGTGTTAGSWNLAGNAGTTSGTNFIGTTDNVGFEIHVFNSGVSSSDGRVEQFTQGTGTSPDITAGFKSNSISTSVDGSVIAGGGKSGSANQINSNFSFVGSGLLNQIDATSDESTIGGGDQNHIWTNSDHGTIAGGGFSNAIGDNAGDAAPYSTVGGGSYNTISTRSSTIAGGYLNTINGVGSANGKLSVIGGGGQNTTNGLAAVVVGGEYNSATGKGAFIGGGSNDPNPNNSVSGENSIVVGGLTNTNNSARAAIVGGETNTIAISSDHSFIGGGFDNQIDTRSWNCTIVGGDQNHIWPDCDHSAIVGDGWTNQIGNSSTPVASHDTATNSIIGGGAYNVIHTKFSSILGGWNNVVNGGTDDELGSIGGGTSNEVSEYAATVSGGGANTADGPWSSISGGTNNSVNNEVQWAVGYYCLPRAPAGIFPFGAGGLPGLAHAQQASIPPVTTPATTVLSPDFDNTLAVIGNGSGSTGRHNAFEVSYNGHSTVFDVNGTGGVDASQPTTFHRAAIQGSTYTDNVCYGWGNCTTSGGVATISPDFGIASVTHTAGTGSYTITLNTSDADRIWMGINGVAVVTLKTAGLLFLTTSSVAGGSFTVNISQLYLGPPPPEGGCCPLLTQPADADFTFVVFGR